MREKRLRHIRDAVVRQGSVTIAGLSQELQVSDETVRRDLDRLASLGLVRRTRGGAAAPGTTLTEQPYQIRQHEHRREKRAIARAAVKVLVEPGLAVALDCGSTTLEIARALHGTGVTVITNSLPVTSELTGSDCGVIVVGGNARAHSMSLIGSLAQSGASQFHCDLAFISAPALTAADGPMDTDMEEIEVKRCLLRNAIRRYVAVDHTKIGKTAFSPICPTDELTGIVTDDGAEPEDLEPFRQLGLEVIVGGLAEQIVRPA
jgi:DeoR/GlpR family transcriptional regulator of sugar metabolism